MRMFVILGLLLLGVGCDVQRGRVVIHEAPAAESPAVNLPVALRQTNWADSRGSGSCVIASSCSMVQWQNNPAAAKFMRENFAGGQTETSIRQKLDSMRLRYAYTNRANEAFLQWASDTRRGAIIWYYPSHCVTFCGFERSETVAGREVAVILDNNRVRNFIRIPRAEFLEKWRGYGGFALTVLGSPVPPPLYERWSANDGPDSDSLPVPARDSILDWLFVRLRGWRSAGV